MFQKLELVWVCTHICRTALPGQPGPDHEARSLSVRTDKCPGHRHGLSLSKYTCFCHSRTLLRIGIDWHGVTIPRVKEYGHEVHLGLHVPQYRQGAKVQTEWEHSHRGVGAKPSSHLMIPAPCNAPELHTGRWGPPRGSVCPVNEVASSQVQEP